MAKNWKPYERKIGKLLTAAYYPDGDGEFRRTEAFSQSGGWTKGMTTGDLVALRNGYDGQTFIDTSFPFSIECKTWKDIKHFFSGLYSEESKMFGWMEQGVNDCKGFKPEKIPLVAFNLYRQKTVVMFRAQDFTKLKELFGEPENIKYYFLRRYPVEHTDYFKPNLLIFMLFSDFIDWIDWSFYKVLKHKYIRSMVKTNGNEEETERKS